MNQTKLAAVQDAIERWLYWHSEVIRVGASAILIVCLIFCGVFWVANIGARAGCRSTANAMNVAWQYSPWIDCMISVDGKMIPLTAYKVVRVAPN